jgi:uncharacterized protein YsxB (DUF464 family)
MTKVSFDLHQTRFKKLTVMGHSGYSEEGSDVVCAAISASVNLANSILEKSGVKYTERVGKTSVILELTDTDEPIGQYVFDALFTELEAISRDFPQNLKVTAAERSAK